MSYKKLDKKLLGSLWEILNNKWNEAAFVLNGSDRTIQLGKPRDSKLLAINFSFTAALLTGNS